MAWTQCTAPPTATAIATRKTSRRTFNVFFINARFACSGRGSAAPTGYRKHDHQDGTGGCIVAESTVSQGVVRQFRVFPADRGESLFGLPPVAGLKVVGRR